VGEILLLLDPLMPPPRYRSPVTTSAATRLGTQAAHNLADTGQCTVGPGMTDAELSRVEQEYGFEFAEDHRAFLSVGLPLNTTLPKEPGVIYTHAQPWPDWRDGDPDALRDALSWPTQGILDGVGDGAWHESWGARPQDPAEVINLAETCLAKVPRMIPIYGHRYLPGGRATSGHPVLSMWGTDIICYGTDLVDYIHQEFGGPGIDRTDPRWQPRVTVDFWIDYV
jgi:hypothetical protein